jgi:hypothetical protein
MAEAAKMPSFLTAYTNSDWNEEPFQFFVGSTSAPDGPFTSAKMSLRAPGASSNAAEFNSTNGELTITSPNEIGVTAPLSLMSALAPGIYAFDLVVTYTSGDIETVLTGQVRIVQGIS